jgi:uncharacterized RDD family membrane protein YckC
MSVGETQLDTTIDIVTPENIAFHYRVAGPFRRGLAFFLDLLVRFFAFAVISFGVSMLGGVLSSTGLAIGVILLSWFVMEWFYGGLFETYMNGQTPGKWVMGIRVLTVEGQPINGMQAVLRNFLRLVDMCPMLSLELLGVPAPLYVLPIFVVGLVTMTMTRRFQRLGDLVCGTIVVIEERHWLTGIAKLEDPRAIQLAEYLPADFRVSPTLAKTLATYVERRRFFSRPRRREVARHLAEPLLRQFGLPADTSYDLLLCALYYRTFVADRGDDSWDGSTMAESPFAPAADNEPRTMDRQQHAVHT